MCAVFPRVARKNRTPTIGTYHAAAGKKCGFEMRNNATAELQKAFAGGELPSAERYFSFFWCYFLRSQSAKSNTDKQ